ncbi:MAG: signal transduction histidine kinase [Janthinobacterium sp.]|jgi:signal transduction histidine kinase
MIRVAICDDPDIVQGGDDREPTLAIALFRIVQEALTNIMKYAQANTVVVTLKREHHGLMLRIIDDGIGIPREAEAKPMSHGLLGMRERALQLGGRLTVRRGRNDKGTCAEACIPLPHRAPDAERHPSYASPAGADNGSLSPCSTRQPGAPILDDQ